MRDQRQLTHDSPANPPSGALAVFLFHIFYLILLVVETSSSPLSPLQPIPQPPAKKFPLLGLNIFLLTLTVLSVTLYIKSGILSTGWFGPLIFLLPPFGFIPLLYVILWLVYIVKRLKRRPSHRVGIGLLCFSFFLVTLTGVFYYNGVYLQVGLSSIERFAPGYDAENRVTVSEILPPIEEFGMFGNNLFEHNGRVYMWSWSDSCSIDEFIAKHGTCEYISRVEISLGYFDQDLRLAELGDAVWDELDVYRYKQIARLPFTPFLAKLGDGYYIGDNGTAHLGSLEGGPTITMPIINDHYSNETFYVYRGKLYVLDGTFGDFTRVREMNLDGTDSRVISEVHSPYCSIARILSDERGVIQVERSNVPYGGPRTHCFSYLIRDEADVEKLSTSVYTQGLARDTRTEPTSERIPSGTASIYEITDHGIDTEIIDIISVISFNVQIYYNTPDAGEFILAATAVSPNGHEVKLLTEYYKDRNSSYVNLLLDLEDFGKENVTNGAYSLKNIELYERGTTGYDRGNLVARYTANNGVYRSQPHVTQ